MAVKGDGSNRYHMSDSADLTFPNSDWGFSIWQRRVASAGANYIVSIGTFGGTSSFSLYWSSGEVRFLMYDDSDNTHTRMDLTTTLNQWYFLAIGRSGSTKFFKTAIPGDTSVTTVGSFTGTFLAIDNTTGMSILARSDANFYGTSECAELALMDSPLSDEEILACANGASVLEVRGSALKAYHPLTAEVATQRDLIGANDAPESGAGITTVEHPPIHGGGGVTPMIVTPAAAAGANPKGPFGMPLYGPFGGPI